MSARMLLGGLQAEVCGTGIGNGVGAERARRGREKRKRMEECMFEELEDCSRKVRSCYWSWIAAVLGRNFFFKSSVERGLEEDTRV